MAALAIEAARRGHRPLVVELGHRASMESVFGRSPIGYSPVDVGRGVHAMNVDVREAIIDYLAEHVRVRALAKRIAGNRALDRFFEAAPAVAEIATLNKLRALERAEKRGSKLWHPIFVDLDATGHAIMFLDLPRVFDGIARGGPLRRLLDGLTALLTDRTVTELHLVTLPSELPVQETIELHRIVAARDVALGSVFVNQVAEPPLGPGDERVLDALAMRAANAGMDELVADAHLARDAASSQRAATMRLARLAEEVPLPQVRLPLLDHIDGSALAQLGGEAARQMGAHA